METKNSPVETKIGLSLYEWSFLNDSLSDSNETDTGQSVSFSQTTAWFVLPSLCKLYKIL